MHTLWLIRAALEAHSHEAVQGGQHGTTTSSRQATAVWMTITLAHACLLASMYACRSARTRGCIWWRPTSTRLLRALSVAHARAPGQWPWLGFIAGTCAYVLVSWCEMCTSFTQSWTRWSTVNAYLGETPQGAQRVASQSSRYPLLHASSCFTGQTASQTHRQLDVVAWLCKASLHA